MPPSVSTARLSRDGFAGGRILPSIGSITNFKKRRSSRNGESTGGNAAEAATAVARSKSGSRCTPKRKSAMYSLEKRNSDPVVRLLEQKKKRGRKGSLLRLASAPSRLR